MQFFFSPWRVVTAAVVATAVAASAAVSRTPEAPIIERLFVPQWLLGGRPDLPMTQVQRFTRRADPGQRAAVARIITEEAQAHGVPVTLALAVAHVESGLRPAHLVTGPPTRYGRALGTMQVLPSTGRAMGCGNLRDTRANVRCGVRYLRASLTRNGGDHGLAALEYHGGPNRRLWGARTHRYRQAVLARTGAREQTAWGAPRSWAAAGNDHFMAWWLNR